MAHPFNLKPQTLELLGLTEKDMQVYTALLRLETAPLRKIAEEASLNRGTAYDAIKRLMSNGLVSFVDAKKRRYFTAEDPQKLRGLATRKEVELKEARLALDEALPDLRALIGVSGHRPSVRYYESASGVRDILEDVLLETEKTRTKTYRVYSSSGIRDLIAASWPRYNQARKKKAIQVKAIAIGSGGETHGLDERKWLSQDDGAPTYIFIYGKKTAYVGVDGAKKLFGVIIEDDAIAETQRMIFDALWRTLSFR